MSMYGEDGEGYEYRKEDLYYETFLRYAKDVGWPILQTKKDLTCTNVKSARKRLKK